MAASSTFSTVCFNVLTAQENCEPMQAAARSSVWCSNCLTTLFRKRLRISGRCPFLARTLPGESFSVRAWAAWTRVGQHGRASAGARSVWAGTRRVVCDTCTWRRAGAVRGQSVVHMYSAHAMHSLPAPRTYSLCACAWAGSLCV